MPLNRRDCVQLIREVEVLIREYDPGSLELVFGAPDFYNDPPRYLVEILRRIRKIHSERSGGMYGPILDRINHFVRLEDDSPVRALSVALSPAEQEVYGIDEVSLAALPDRSQFLEELDRIIDSVLHEISSSENPQ